MQAMKTNGRKLQETMIRNVGKRIVVLQEGEVGLTRRMPGSNELANF